MPARPDTARPTLAEMRHAAPWLWLWCRNVNCRHKEPMALAPLIIRWGGGASSDLLRQSARCKCCGRQVLTFSIRALAPATLRWLFMRERRIGVENPGIRNGQSVARRLHDRHVSPK